MSKGGKGGKVESVERAPSADAAPIPGFGGIAEGEAVASIALDSETVVIPASDPIPDSRFPIPESIPDSRPDPVHPDLVPLLAERDRVFAANVAVKNLADTVQAMEAALESLVRDQKAVIAAKTQELREAIDARQKLRAVSQVEGAILAVKKRLGIS